MHIYLYIYTYNNVKRVDANQSAQQSVDQYMTKLT